MPVDAVGRDVAQALDGVGQRAGEMRSALLAVGDHVEARTLLQRDRPVDGRVLDALELRGRELAVLVLTARLEQLGRPQQRADRLGSGHPWAHPAHVVSAVPPQQVPGRCAARLIGENLGVSPNKCQQSYCTILSTI